MAIVLALGALALSGFTFYLFNQHRTDNDNRFDKLERELRNHKADLQAKVNLNFGKNKG